MRANPSPSPVSGSAGREGPVPSLARGPAGKVAGVVVAIVLVVGLIVGLLTARPASLATSATLPSSDPDGLSTTTTDEAPATTPPWTAELAAGLDLLVTVDDTLRPHRPAIEGLESGQPERPIGRMVGTDGRASDLVLDELVVTVDSDAELAAVVDRFGAVVLDELDPEAPDGEPRDVLLRVDPTKVATDRVAEDILSVEAQQGEVRAGGQPVLQVLAASAEASAHLGVGATPNWVDADAAIDDGTAQEHEDIEKNTFEWSWIRHGDGHNIGVGPAWQLLGAEGQLDERVRVLVLDRGFVLNPDFPDGSRIRKGDWGTPNPGSCSNDTPCPFHGTDVAMNVVGKVDNEWGIAGTGGPVGELVAMTRPGDRYQTYKKLREVVEEERPRVVNMSHSGTNGWNRAAEEDRADRTYGKLRGWGSLLVASAGNDGDNVDVGACIGSHCYETSVTLPCESVHVLCVGGMSSGGDFLDAGSNWGSSADRRSVEIYGPMCTRPTWAPNPSATDTKSVCGTSVSSPVVAGVAALVMAADPNLSGDAVRDLLKETAHKGGVTFDVNLDPEKQRRVNALAAVSEALGVQPAKPTVDIVVPIDGAELAPYTVVDFRATSESFAGGTLDVSWHSSLDGSLGRSASGAAFSMAELSGGSHVITASVTDLVGQTTEDWVVVEVVDHPPTVSISSPAEGTERYVGEQLTLAGLTQDDIPLGPLSDDAVAWEVRRKVGGTLVVALDGHQRSVSTVGWQAGEYEVHFIATTPAGTWEDSVTVALVAVDPDDLPPIATILSPGTGATVGHATSVTLEGHGADPETAAISGTRMRWTARSQAGTEVVLCQGSNFPGNGGGLGGIAQFKDCSSFEVVLGTDPAVGDEGGDGWIDPTLWTITLEVADPGGQRGRDDVVVTVEVYIP